jgi:hypothetical protein
MQAIDQLLPAVDQDGGFKQHQRDMLQGSAFGRLNAYDLMDMYTRGVDLLAIIINTCNCDQGG